MIDYETKRRMAFEAKTKQCPISECLLWTAGKTRFGYGQFRHGPNQAAHRVSYLFYVGKIPPRMQVLHKCDNPACVTPKHLFLGTNADNIADMVKKGRQAKGDRVGSAKLDDRKVLEIFKMRNSRKFTRDEIAKKFGVTNAAVQAVLCGTNFKHVKRPKLTPFHKSHFKKFGAKGLKSRWGNE